MDETAAAILEVAPYYTDISDQGQQYTPEEVAAFFGIEAVRDADVLTFHADVASDRAGNAVIGDRGSFLFVSFSFIDPEQSDIVPQFIESMRAGGGRDVAMDYIDTLDLPGPTTEEELGGASGLGDAGWGLSTETMGAGYVPVSLLYFSRGNVVVMILADSDALLDVVAVGRVVDEEILRVLSG